MEEEVIDVLQKVPEEIRDWFGSEKIAKLIMEMNRMLGLKDEKIFIISELLYLLEIKELHIRDFVDFLALKLKTTPQKSVIIAREIKEKILAPIQTDLIGWGIDPDLIDLASTEDRTTIKDIAFEKLEKPLVEEVKEPLMETPAMVSATTIEPPQPPQPTEPLATKPFVLYEEKPLIEEKRKPFLKPFSLPFKIFGQKPEAQTTVPVQVKIETSEPPALPTEVKPKISKIEKPHRVVNYSEFRTPLSPFGQEEGVINLETFETSNKEPAPAAEPPKTENDNSAIIDLKQDV